MNFIMVPAIFGIVSMGVYKLFELFVRRRERIMLIEKLDPSQLPSFDPGKLQPSTLVTANALTGGCLLLGLGLGLLVGVMLYPNLCIPNSVSRDSLEMVYGSSILIFGGIGMIASVFLNRWLMRKE